MTWSGKRVAVTGAAGGIGHALCGELLRSGAEVVAIDVDSLRLGELPASPALVTRVVDITDWAAVESLFSEVGPLDALINNAGITALGPLFTTPVGAIDRVLDVNLRGAIYCTRAALPGLMERRGLIGVMSSVAGFAPLVNRAAYSAAKHGMHGFFESLRTELSGTGVTVTLICPTFTRTGIEARAAHRADGPSGAWSTTGPMMEPAELSRLILKGMAGRRRLVLPGRTARLSYRLWRLSPAGYEWLMLRRMRVR